MGETIRFPQERCRWPTLELPDEPASIIILPVVRIEREGAPVQVGRQRRASRPATFTQFPLLEPIVSTETERRVQEFLDDLRRL